MRQPRRRRLRA